MLDILQGCVPFFERERERKRENCVRLLIIVGIIFWHESFVKY